MNILVVGGGGREHALCLGLSNSNKVGKIFCSPGNAGTAIIADNVDLDITNNSIITKYCLEKSIDLVFQDPVERKHAALLPGAIRPRACGVRRVVSVLWFMLHNFLNYDCWCFSCCFLNRSKNIKTCIPSMSR